MRGGILDVFAPDAEHPVRADFFGDELEQLQHFSVADQRSLPDDADAHRAAAEPRAAAHRGRAAACPRDGARVPDPGADAREDRRGHPGRGHGVARPRAAADSSCRSPTTCLGMPRSPSWARSGSRPGPSVSPRRTASSSTPRGTPPPRERRRRSTSIAGDFLTVNGLRAAAGDRTWWTLSPFDSGDDDVIRVCPRDPVPTFVGQADGAVDHVAALARDGWQVTVTASGAGLVERAAEVLADRGAVVAVEQGAVEAGFQLPDATPTAGDRRPQRGRVLRPQRGRRLPPGEAAREPPQERRRPAAAAGRRLRRAPDARHRPVRRTRAARGRQRHPHPARPARHHGHRGQGGARVPRARVRAEQARVPGRQALRADRPARPAHPLRRRRGARAVEDGRIRLGGRQGQGAQGGARHRRRTGQALQRAHGVGAGTPSRPTPRGSANSRRRSRSSRRPTSWSPSTR